jgi:8-oxo-dGTP diphosphatase
MIKGYTAEENISWRAKQPQKMIVSKVIIKSDQGNILILKSNYKKTWQFPGGGVDNNESPEAGAVREVREETGLTVKPEDLSVVGTIYKQDEELLFIIYEYNISIREDTVITVQDDESTAYKFIDIKDAVPYLSEYYEDFWQKKYLRKS